MYRRTSRIVALLLILAVSIPMALAADGRYAEGRAIIRVPVFTLGDLLSGFWTFLVSLWNEAGCSLDPSGRCIPGTGGGDEGGSTVTGDEGCSLDPHGRCLPGL